MSSLNPLDVEIVTVDSPKQIVLEQPTKPIKENEWALARAIGEKLLLALWPHFPAAGLAAPQIGISRSVFIFSFDRDPKNLEVVINPSLTSHSQSQVKSWEGCLSIILSNGIWKLAKIPRYERIKVTYFNLKREKKEKILEGFAAKVFQHEYDHLQGIVNIDREDAEVKTFESKEELLDYLQAVKNEDASRYIKPAEDSHF